MGMPRKRSRVIDVDGKSFRWMLNCGSAQDWDEDPTCAGTVTVQENCEKPGHVLQQILMWLGGDSVTPEIMREVIRRALADGWVPSSRTKPGKNIHNKKVDVSEFETKLSIVAEVHRL
jgi:hypothetical protein